MLRVSYGTFSIHGANADGSGGAGETNTLEIQGIGRELRHPRPSRRSPTSTSFASSTPIRPAPRLTTPRASAPTSMPATSSRAGFLRPSRSSGRRPLRRSPRTPSASRSTTPPPRGRASIFPAGRLPTGTTDDSYININTSTKLALADVIVGSKVADNIYTGAGNDIIRGGGGADSMAGGSGRDTFVFGTNEAAPEEYFYTEDDGPNDDRSHARARRQRLLRSLFRRDRNHGLRRRRDRDLQSIYCRRRIRT